MKSIKLIAGIFAGMALLFTGCKEEYESGEDMSKPVPSDFGYDVENNTTDVLAFYWDATETVKAGATSYSIEICDDPSEAVSMYDDVIQTVQVSAIGSDGIGRATFTKGISEYTEKYVRIRVNYGAVFSSWTFARDDEGNPAAFVAGHGMKDLNKASVGTIDIDCPEDSDSFTISADLTPVASASRVLVILMDYASQSAISTILVDPSKAVSYTHLTLPTTPYV